MPQAVRVGAPHWRGPGGRAGNRIKNTNAGGIRFPGSVWASLKAIPVGGEPPPRELPALWAAGPCIFFPGRFKPSFSTQNKRRALGAGGWGDILSFYPFPGAASFGAKGSRGDEFSGFPS